MTPAAESIITTLSLYPSLATATLIGIEVHHGYPREEIVTALENLQLIGRVRIDGASVSLVKKPWDDDLLPPASLAVADQYRRNHHPTLGDRLVAPVMNAWRWCMDTFDRIRDRIIGGLCLLIITTFFTIGLCAAELPSWALPGMLARESSSYYTAAGAVVYRDQSIGTAGELGPFQMRRAAFDQVAESGEAFERLAYDTAFAERLAIRYLHWLHRRTGDWFIAIGRWNAGPTGDYGVAWRYAKDVQKRGQRSVVR
jgi:hypothetical protein